MRRRDILRSLLHAPLALLGTAALLAGCGSDDESTSSTSSGCDGSEPTQISSNHGHTVCLTQAELDAGAAVTLTLTTNTTYGHAHTLSLSADDVATIKAGGSVSHTSSSSAGHTHQVQFN